MENMARRGGVVERRILRVERWQEGRMVTRGKRLNCRNETGRFRRANRRMLGITRRKDGRRNERRDVGITTRTEGRGKV
jgi:hypothetical protein